MKPPTTSTLPFLSKVAVGPERAAPSEPVALQVDSRASTIVALASRHIRSAVLTSDTKPNHARVGKATKKRECGFTSQRYRRRWIESVRCRTESGRRFRAPPRACGDQKAALSLSAAFQFIFLGVEGWSTAS